MEPREEFLQRLKTMYQAGAVWHELAKTLLQRPEHRSRRDWRLLLADASRATGLAPIMLPRYVKLLEKMRSIAGSPSALTDLMAHQFHATETAVRLYERNPTKGMQALKDLKAGATTGDEIREQLAKEPHSPDDLKTRTHRLRNQLFKEAERALQSEAERLFGQGCTVGRRASVPTLSRTGYEVFSEEGNPVAAIDLYLPDISISGDRDPFEPLAQSLLLSRYVPQFYVLLAPGFTQQDVRRLETLIDAFEDEAVGILHMPDAQSIDPIRRPRRPVKRYGRLFEGLRGSAEPPEPDDDQPEEDLESKFRM